MFPAFRNPLSYGLCHFICEVKKINGDDFPPKTIYEMIVCVQIYLESRGIFWKLLDDMDMDFVKLCYTCDNIMKEHASGGLGNVIRQAEVISYDNETFLWKNEYLGSSTPELLVRTLLFQIGLYYTLCAGSEHHNLRSIGFRSQFHYTMPDRVHHIVYREDLGTKTNKGRLRYKKISGKEVTIYPNVHNRSRCPVAIFYKYHCKLPANKKNGALYLQPRPVYSDNAWYMDAPIGINKLQNTVKDMTTKAGLTGRFTNHLLHATSAGVEAQVITEVTGHQSLAVQSYKKTNEAQK